MHQNFLYPELFLLAIPAAFVYWKWCRGKGVTGWLRILLISTLILALTGPRLNVGGSGLDVVVVVDRSRSLPADASARIRELLDNVFHARRGGDRAAIVTFGSTSAVEQILLSDGDIPDFKQIVLPDGSDLSAALHQALELLNDPRRPGRILVFSDGEANGPNPIAAARRARDMGIPIDYRDFPRLRTRDVAVQSVELPEVVRPLEPFQFSVWIASDGDSEGTITVLRDGQPLSQDREPRSFRSGLNRLIFRDILNDGGLHHYEVQLDTPDDPLIENNKGAGVVRVEASPRLLVLNQDGQPDNFVRALWGGQINVDVQASKTFPLTADSLDAYRAVVVENVPAGDFDRVKLERLAQFVEDQGGGLLVTGGERSFGSGGYFKSPLDDVLPVSMEMREEHRKTRIAMAIVLDRSGSMAVPVKGGKQKMDLADLGTAECVRLLSSGDSVAIIAVDELPHTIQALTNVDDPEPIAKKALSIKSEGGGIYIYNALVAAGDELKNAEQLTKHVILFADAADSEVPGDYKTLLSQFEKAGITVSVIGLGTDRDQDAELLKEIALLGHGNILFTQDAEELPRLFTQDTMSVARSSFVKRDPMTQPGGIPGHIDAGTQLISEFPTGAFPGIDGYNLSYLKPDATLGVISDDEYKAPWAAYWYRGLGRVAAVTLEVDGPYTGAFGQWDDYGDFAVTISRWLLGGGDLSSAYVSISRNGQEAVVTLELDPDRPLKNTATAPTLIVIPPGDEREAVRKIPLQWRGPDMLEASYRLDRTGTFRSQVVLDGQTVIRAPAVALPYSPEFLPRTGLPAGSDVLQSLAELSGGKPRVDIVDIFQDRPRSAQWLSLIPHLCSAAVLMLLLEIAGRRLSLWRKLTEAILPAEVIETLVGKRPKKPASLATRPAIAPKPAGSAAAVQAELPPVSPPAQPSAAEIFEQAKRRAKRRTD